MGFVCNQINFSALEGDLLMQPIDNPASLAPAETPTRYSMPPLLWGPAGLAAAAKPLAWLWQGFLAPGAVTLMTSQWKAGKTTLASVLLARMQTGGVFAGRPLAAGKAIVVSEEGPESGISAMASSPLATISAGIAGPSGANPSRSNGRTSSKDWPTCTSACLTPCC